MRPVKWALAAPKLRWENIERTEKNRMTREKTPLPSGPSVRASMIWEPNPNRNIPTCPPKAVMRFLNTEREPVIFNPSRFMG